MRQHGLTPGVRHKRGDGDPADRNKVEAFLTRQTGSGTL